MIKKIFKVAFILLLFYSIAIRIVGKRLEYSQTYWQSNMIKMQDFIYGTDTSSSTKNVIIGSSLSDVGLAGLGSQYYNLAAGGSSPFTGFEIIKRTKRKIRRVFIEGNYLLINAPAKDKYLNSLFMPGFYAMRKYFPVLLEKNQPVTVIGSCVQNILFSDVPLANDGELSAELKRKRIASFKETYADSVSVKPIAEGDMVLLGNYLSYLRANGIELVFYEMPVDCTLTNNPLPVYYRNKINEFCGLNNLRQLPLDSCEKYNTKDGNHFDTKSAEKYQIFFESEVNKLNNRK